jgi:hypothetical protein
MKTTTLTSLVIAAATVTSMSLAQANTPAFTAAYEQQGLTYQPLVPTAKTRAEVMKELQEFRNNPVSADGQYRFVGGEKQWEAVMHSYDIRNGMLVHTDSISHDTPRPSLVMTAAEKRAAEELYGRGG